MAAKSGFSLHVTIFIDPLNVAEFFKHFKLAYENVIAEPECTFFEVYQSPENPGELRWVENWSASVKWFQEHQMTKEYYKPYFEATEPLFVKPRQFQIHNRMEGYFYAA
ncbi:hypothetical protein BGZ61DRAFT_533762 [Ilyonectria robusta]|uniref:uncharacterized protein n=1 Tax=Ilyonectria robusta TaxID=1079257 RepID=UPI001E8E67E6|nr:uncharacterized protein BGZ61DRAFT_533762 [Ilyonectria robusta]KAH8686199.1 hypothetical protein BGZ61DRAFT_533762 [Ilyonectria robusta]